MKLLSVKIKNFRGYQNETTISFENLTVIVGRNDAGKSTILEALEIFFNNRLIKIDPSDLSNQSDSEIASITCVFDVRNWDANPTSPNAINFTQEHLLNTDGHLEIMKEFTMSLKTPTERIYIVANYPTLKHCNDLYKLTNKELKERVMVQIPEQQKPNLSDNSQIRVALYGHFQSELGKATTILPIDPKSNSIWNNIQEALPEYVLFQSDRSSTDQDDEIQDPMKLAIREAMDDINVKIMLEKIKEKVKEGAESIVKETLNKLTQIHPDLGTNLKPIFKTEPKWDSIFKIALNDQNEISLNKKGGGTRRLVLVSFLQAMAERARSLSGYKSIIYAIEEPETAQHPDNQKRLIDSFIELTALEGRQIILTTHVPGLAGLIPFNALRFIDKEKNNVRVISAQTESQDDVLNKIAERLGVFANHNLQVLVYVEGKNDVEFLIRAAKILRQENPDLPDLENDKRVAFIPSGGSTLQHWIDKRYLRELKLKEVHIYDRDDENKPKYAKSVNRVNSRKEGHVAYLTKKRELESYIHPDAIHRVLSVRNTFPENCDIEEIVEHGISRNKNSLYKQYGTNKPKDLLNTVVVESMSVQEFKEMDPEGEIVGWLQAIADRLK